MAADDPSVSRHHEGLIAVLRERGAGEDVLAAIAAVPRERFVDRFWAAPPGAPPRDPDAIREWVVGRDDGALDLVYEPDLALITAGSAERRTATSSVSAPALVALMLAEADLAPGRRVLEIGAGSGWHAALMAELVGDPALVTTVDIDADLVEATRRRLDALDLGALTVVCADGDGGHAANRPFDRIVVTVGCADLAPAWVDQLAPGGTILVPLVHGVAHPRVRVAVPAGSRAEGRFVGPSGFVAVQGEQAGASPWPATGPPAGTGPGPEARTVPLPADLAGAIAGDGSTGGAWSPASSAFALYLALRDGRAGFGASLVDDDAGAAVQGTDLVMVGDADELAAVLLALARDWVDLGAPGLDRYTTSFARRPVGTPALDPSAPAAGPWSIRRLRHDQTVMLHP